MTQIKTTAAVSMLRGLKDAAQYMTTPVLTTAAIVVTVMAHVKGIRMQTGHWVALAGLGINQIGHLIPIFGGIGLLVLFIGCIMCDPNARYRK